MYPSTVTLFWRDKTTKQPALNEDGTPKTEADGTVVEVEVPYPPVTQDVGGFFVEGNALILVQDEQSSYLIPLDILDAVSIFRKTEGGENATDSGDSDGTAPDATILKPEFGGGSEGS